MGTTKVAILGSGNIGVDLMIKTKRRSKQLEVAAICGIDPNSEGLARASKLGVATTSDGIDGLVTLPEWQDIEIVFDATSAGAHANHYAVCQAHGKRIIDLTPAAIGPFCVPVVNGEGHAELDNVNMVTCGGQATVPIVAAVRACSETVPYAEIVSSISSRSAGPGTRANIDEFTETTSRAIEDVGGADVGKAIIVLNPAEPPLIMRNTVFTLSQGSTPEQIEASITEMVERVQSYVPGYRLKQRVQFEQYGANRPLKIPGQGEFTGIKPSVFLEVEGAGHFLPPYAGNLDIMTSAAMAMGEKLSTSPALV